MKAESRGGTKVIVINSATFAVTADAVQDKWDSVAIDDLLAAAEKMRAAVARECEKLILSPLAWEPLNREPMRQTQPLVDTGIFIRARHDVAPTILDRSMLIQATLKEIFADIEALDRELGIVPDDTELECWAGDETMLETPS